MNTTAALFFLIVGQASGDASAATSTTVIPTPYTSQVMCEGAGEAARANNQGLSYVSYTCVPAVAPDAVCELPTPAVAKAFASRVVLQKALAGTVVGMAKP
jgi:uncharacterized membrane protein